MNKNLVVAGLIAFSTLPAFAKTESIDILTIDRTNFARVDDDKLALLEDAGILEANGNVVTVNLEALKSLIQLRRTQNKPSTLPANVMDIISNSSVVVVPYGNT